MSISWRGNSVVLPFHLEPGDICVHCKTHIFNSRIYQDLISAKSQDTINAAYTQQCLEIYASFSIGCPWCSAIAKAIRFNAELVTFMNSDDDDADQTYGEYLIANLDCEAIVDVKVSFYKSQGREAIDSIKIQIEVINPDNNACGLPEMKDADSTFLNFEISSNGTFLALLCIIPYYYWLNSTRFATISTSLGTHLSRYRLLVGTRIKLDADMRQPPSLQTCWGLLSDTAYQCDRAR